MLARTASRSRAVLPVGWRVDEPEAGNGESRKNGQVIRDSVVDGMHFRARPHARRGPGVRLGTQIQEEAEMNKQLEALVARADEIKEALAFTQELTVALKPEDQERASASWGREASGQDGA
jgi:hypothetical protein